VDKPGWSMLTWWLMLHFLVDRMLHVCNEAKYLVNVTYTYPNVAFVWVCPDVFQWHPTNYYYTSQPVLAKINVKLSFLVFFCMKWLRYQRVISLKIQVGNTNQKKKWANTDLQIYRRWDQVLRRSKHPLLIDHTRREPSSMIMNEELSYTCMNIHNDHTNKL
jgi:hypothetical protein